MGYPRTSPVSELSRENCTNTPSECGMVAGEWLVFALRIEAFAPHIRRSLVRASTHNLWLTCTRLMQINCHSLPTHKRLRRMGLRSQPQRISASGFQNSGQNSEIGSGLSCLDRAADIGIWRRVAPYAKLTRATKSEIPESGSC